MAFSIFTDTSANLPTAYLRSEDIGVVPFTYTVFGRDYQCLDTAAFESEGFYNAMRRGVEVSTTLVRPELYLAAFRPRLAAGEDLLFVGMIPASAARFSAPCWPPTICARSSRSGASGWWTAWAPLWARGCW